MIKCKSRGCNNEFEPFYRNGIIISKMCLSCLSKKGKPLVKKARNEEKKAIKQSLKSHSELQGDLQDVVNKLIRLIDHGQNCISQQKHFNSYDAGHYYSRGSDNSLRFHLHNIYRQSVHANQHLHGDSINFRVGLIANFGQSHMNYVENLKVKYPSVKLTRDELIEKKEIVKRLIKAHKPEKLTNLKRLYYRDLYNKEIGIYEI